MARVRVKMVSKGSDQLLKSEAVQNDLRRRVDAVAEAAGEGFEARVKVGRTRAVASVSATTIEAAEREATDRVLLKALDAAR